jgi:flagellar basal-body rod modification protein FlgD
MSEIKPITGTNPLAGWEAPAVTASNGQLDKNSFLKLLVAQLQNQNVADPMDPAEVMAQTTQLTLVEKMNELVESTAASTAAQRLSLAASLVGKDVTYNDSGVKTTGKVDSVRLESGTLWLQIGDKEVSSDEVVSVGPKS